MWFRGTSPREERSGVTPSSGYHRPSSQLTLPPSAIRQLDRLRLSGSRFLRGQGIGQRSSFRRKPAPYFIEHRMYVPGDDIRFVDWNASARHDHIFVKQGVHPKEITTNLLLDCSASMMWGEPAKEHGQRMLAAALGYLALAHGDRLYIQGLSAERRQSLGPISGKGQIPELLRFLNSLKYGASVDLQRDIQHFSKKATWHGLTLVLSDLLGVDSLSPILAHLPMPSWDVIILHLLHPEETNPSLQGQLELVDIESGASVNLDITQEVLDTYRQRIAKWKRELDLTCVESGAFYLDIPTHLPLDTAVIPLLRSVNVVRSL